MKMNPMIQKHWPWIVGGGVSIGLIWLLISDDGESSSSDSMGGDMSDYYNYQLTAAAANSQNALVAQQVGAQVQLAAAQASAMQDAAQAEVIASQAMMAKEIGGTYAQILAVTAQPQLQAMQASRDVAQDAIYSAAESQIAGYGLMSDAVRGYSNMVGGLHAQTPATLAAGASAIRAGQSFGVEAIKQIGNVAGGLVNVGGLMS